MPRQTELAHAAVRAVLRPGEAAVDATAGNGHDTLFLAGVVGPAGRVYALDIDPAAVARTAARLRAAGLTNVTLHRRDHADLAGLIPTADLGRVGAVMFNLGYRPGGDRMMTTQPGTTVPALWAGLDLLRPGGVTTVIAYPGHPGGAEEAAAVAAFARNMPADQWEMAEVPPEGNPDTGPRLFIVRRLPARSTQRVTSCGSRPGRV